MKRKVLITGAGGNIGFYLARGLAGIYEVIPAVHDYEPPGLRGAIRMDITDGATVRETIRKLRPYAVVNAAAIADANVCEKDPKLARAVNVAGARNVARVCEELGAYLVQYSTDLVFDGHAGMYREDDEPNPLSVYAATKLESEGAALSSDTNASVLRTAIVYGKSSGKRKTFFEVVIEKARKGDSVKVFADQYRSFMYAGDSASAVASLIENDCVGIYHAGGAERLSRYDFMTRALDRLGVSTDTLEKTSMADLPGQASRPPDCSLDSSKLIGETGWRPTPFEEAMARLEKSL